jgi:hypothetical protein
VNTNDRTDTNPLPTASFVIPPPVTSANPDIITYRDPNRPGTPAEDDDPPSSNEPCPEPYYIYNQAVVGNETRYTNGGGYYRRMGGVCKPYMTITYDTHGTSYKLFSYSPAAEIGNQAFEGVCYPDVGRNYNENAYEIEPEQYCVGGDTDSPLWNDRACFPHPCVTATPDYIDVDKVAQSAAAEYEAGICPDEYVGGLCALDIVNTYKAYGRSVYYTQQNMLVDGRYRNNCFTSNISYYNAYTGGCKYTCDYETVGYRLNGPVFNGLDVIREVYDQVNDLWSIFYVVRGGVAVFDDCGLIYENIPANSDADYLIEAEAYPVVSTHCARDKEQSPDGAPPRENQMLFLEGFGVAPYPTTVIRNCG